EALRAALAGPAWDAITCESGVPRLDTARVLETVRDAWPTVPILIVSGRRPGEFEAALRSGLADGYINKDAIDDLAAAVRHLVPRGHPASSHCAAGLGS
ncbi:MAG: response regulator, partial [bacterium]